LWPSARGRIIKLMMFRRGRAGRPRSATLVATLFYLLVLAASAFEHHDLLCHLRNPQHCTACSASQLGADPPVLAAAAASSLNDAGGASAMCADPAGAVLAARSTGRSPPHHA
jgi:hypothetical protein